MKRVSVKVLLAMTASALVVVAGSGTQSTLAQGPNRPSINVQSFNACTTTDYASIAAKALGITPAVLRKDIVAGQTIQEIITAANGNMQTVVDAIQAARKVDIDQAVKDGVITQDEGTALETPATPPANPPQVGTRPAGGGQGGGRPGNPPVAFPDISTIRAILQQNSGTPATPGGPGGGPSGLGGGFGIGVGLFNRIKQYDVAAKVVNIKCADLVKTLITPPGKSIVDVGNAAKIDPKTISDALTKAYKDALALNVIDGVITQDQSDQLAPVVDKAVATFIYNPLPMGVQATATPAK